MKILLLSIAATFAATAADYPPLGAVPNPESRGPGIQRTMALLATSTPEKRNPVRILFYGQSITEQNWSKIVAEDLRKRFPNADLTIENRAIGGHASSLLVKTAEADLYPFYPDLVIFHVFGDHRRYEDIIRRIRERTTSEVLLQSDHLSASAKRDEETDPSKLTPANWEPWFNYSFLPSLVEKYGVALATQRDDWKLYLASNKLEPKDLLKDGVHLNPHGEFLMAEIVKTYLRYDPAHPPADPGPVRTIPLEAGKYPYEIKFTGNRVDAVVEASADPAEIAILIDGKPPSEIRSTTVFTKVSGYRGTNWPCLLRIQRGPTDLLEETWTIRLSGANDDYSTFRFSLTGSETGPDGEGSATEKFVSKSGRIVIDPSDWNLQYSKNVFKQPLEPDAEITFSVKRLSPDRFTAKPGTSTIVQGLAAGEHVLTLRPVAGEPKITALRIYNPPVQSSEELAPDTSQTPAQEN